MKVFFSALQIIKVELIVAYRRAGNSRFFGKGMRRCDGLNATVRSPRGMSGFAMFEAMRDGGEFLPQLQAGLRQIVQLLFIGALLFLHLCNRIAETLRGNDLLIGGIAQGGGNRYAQFAQPHHGNHHKTGGAERGRAGKNENSKTSMANPVKCRNILAGIIVSSRGRFGYWQRDA